MRYVGQTGTVPGQGEYFCCHVPATCRVDPVPSMLRLSWLIPRTYRGAKEHHAPAADGRSCVLHALMIRGTPCSSSPTSVALTATASPRHGSRVESPRGSSGIKTRSPRSRGAGTLDENWSCSSDRLRAAPPGSMCGLPRRQVTAIAMVSHRGNVPLTYRSCPSPFVVFMDRCDAKDRTGAGHSMAVLVNAGEIRNPARWPGASEARRVSLAAATMVLPRLTVSG